MRFHKLTYHNSFCDTLHYAVSLSHRGVVYLLLAKGVNVNAKDNTASTPLSLAKVKGYEKIVELLRGYGANE